MTKLDGLITKLGSIADIFVGLQTSADKIFILKSGPGTGQKAGRLFELLDRNGKSWSIERAVFRPCLLDVPIPAFGQAVPEHFMLFPYDITSGRAALISQEKFGSKFPKAWAYLEANSAALRARENGQFDSNEWYGFGRRQSLTLIAETKLIVQVLARSGRFAYDDKQLHFTGGGNGPYYGLRYTEQFQHRSLQALQAVIGSRVCDFYIRNVSEPFQGGYWSYGKRFLEKIPLPEDMERSSETLERFARILLFLHRQPSVRQAPAEHPRDPELAAWIERWVNALVYELYFPEELRARGLSFLPLTEDHAPPAPAADADPARALAAVRATVTKLSAPGHALRRALDQLQTLDLVRTIEGGP